MNNKMKKLLYILFDNKVVILFVLLCIGAIIAADKPLTFVAAELFTRIGRNTFLVLSLLIPVLAGMGLNFGIVIGAIAAQIAVFWVVYWGVTGIEGFLLCLLISTPIAIFFGFLVGRLFNKMKGSEMIGGMVLGYFAEGLYLLFFLFIIGGIIPVSNPTLIINGGIGVKNTIDLKGNLKYSLDGLSINTIFLTVAAVLIALTIISIIFKTIKKEKINLIKSIYPIVIGVSLVVLTFIPAMGDFLSKDRLVLLTAVELGVVAVVFFNIAKIIINAVKYKEKQRYIKPIVFIIIAAGIYLLTYIPEIFTVLITVKIPVMTYLCILLLCFFNSWLISTRLGQNMRTVGQSRTVANAAGINVDRTRIIAMILSTVLACWGQLICLQNIGTFSTYGAHTQVGQFAIAALLVGGASVHKANNKQAIIGVILFHTLFIVAPQAGKELFNNAQIGEYFRVFVAYGVIAVSLAMHAWNRKKK
ncbi:ABC transporter permease subunit [Alloiococcus sp. CFN-8]|uniref:ABC transporter permease subunit n=1 Tax=Alloiococcus sp. CFN-8 TaxID=3416081 RepID=UPI003CF08B04